MSRSLKIGAAFLILAVFGTIYFIWEQNKAAGGVPETFKNARTQGALISQSIVDYSNGLSSDLDRISQLEKENKFKEALEATNQVVAKSQDIRQKAIDLSRELEQMASSLPQIKSPEARQAALDAISARLALISRLINYSGYLNNLLISLRDKFSGQYFSSEEIAKSVEQINLEVNAINNFNRNAAAAMERFDKIVSGNK